MKFSIDKKVQEVPFYPKAMAYGFEDGWLRLSSNENPFPPSKKVMEALLDALPYMNRYPGGEMELKEAIAAKYGLSADQVVIGNGSNELIEMALRASRVEGKNRIISSEPSFAFYEIAAKIYGFDVKRAPVKDMRIDLKELAGAIDDSTRLIFLNNPLNPTGTIFEEKDFADFMKSVPEEVLVVLDEAYAEFSENGNFPKSIRYIDEYPVVILRTFSKAYGLAGLRVGYGLGGKPIMSFLERTKQPFSVNMMALIAAKTALSDDAYLKKVLDNNREGKRFYYSVLDELGLKYVPTEANFFLIKIGPKAEAVTKSLFEKKIVVRWMGAYNLPEYIRVTIGTMEENRRMIEALKRQI